MPFLSTQFVRWSCLKAVEAAPVQPRLGDAPAAANPDGFTRWTIDEERGQL